MIRLDPRTKLFLLVLVVFFSAFVESGWKESVMIAVIMITGILLGRIKKSIRSAVIFYGFWIFSIYGLPHVGGVLHTSLLAWLVLLFKCYPCCMLAGVVMETTHISEFMAGMTKMKFPREIVIPLVVMFRYFPVVREDWAYIKDAMALRGLTPTPVGIVRNPVAVMDAIYVPMLVSASKAADELSVAALTRGIENPNPRSSRLKIKFCLWDIVFTLIYMAMLIIGM